MGELTVKRQLGLWGYWEAVGELWGQSGDNERSKLRVRCPYMRRGLGMFKFGTLTRVHIHMYGWMIDWLVGWVGCYLFL